MTLVLAAEPLVACADIDHAQCLVIQQLLMAERGPIVLPGPVTEEVDALLAARIGPHARRGFFQDLARHRFHVERLTRRDIAALEMLERDYAELELNLAEMAMIIVAARLECTTLVTFDERPFRAIRPLFGPSFTVLPSDA